MFARIGYMGVGFECVFREGWGVWLVSLVALLSSMGVGFVGECNYKWLHRGVL